ncbi:MAG: polyprenyl synthetase family protein [Candidatus Brocadiia bacterium]
MNSQHLAAYIEARRPRVDEALDGYLPQPEGPAGRLAEAMRYSCFAGGKRLRPVLVLLACELCGGREEDALLPACAVEMVHTYSLIHDDLPAMDDDDVRRGRPSCHKAFDEATAILAGDALLTLAFDILARCPQPARAAAYVAELARGAGAGGMLAGQMADMAFEGAKPTPQAVDFIHAHKTAALAACSLRLGALAADGPREEVERLGRFGHALGLAFQAADDALDVEATSQALGKTAGKDVARGKVTYPAVYGLEDSRRRARQLVADAIAELQPYGPEAELLRQAARYAGQRGA